LNALILRPVNVPQPDTFFALDHVGPLEYESYPTYLDLRDRNHTLAGMAVENISAAALDTGSEPSRTWLIEVSGNYFDVVGIQPFLGRFFHSADERGPNSAPYIVLTYAYWHTHFHDDRGVVGRSVQLNKHPFTVIGVAPPGFIGLYVGFSADFFVPIVSQDQEETDGHRYLNARANHGIDNVLGHLKPGITPAQATA